MSPSKSFICFGLHVFIPLCLFWAEVTSSLSCESSMMDGMGCHLNNEIEESMCKNFSMESPLSSGSDCTFNMGKTGLGLTIIWSRSSGNVNVTVSCDDKEPTAKCQSNSSECNGYTVKVCDGEGKECSTNDVIQWIGWESPKPGEPDITFMIILDASLECTHCILQFAMIDAKTPALCAPIIIKKDKSASQGKPDESDSADKSESPAPTGSTEDPRNSNATAEPSKETSGQNSAAGLSWTLISLVVCVAMVGQRLALHG